MLRMPNLAETSGASSTIDLGDFELPDILRRYFLHHGVSMRHGAHQGAQKSTNKGSEDSETTLSKLESFNSTTFSP